MEIERKFVVDRHAFGEHLVRVRRRLTLQQGYLSRDDGELRVRAVEEEGSSRFWLTEKHGTGLVREEAEQEISSNEFETMWPATAGRRIEKTRLVLAATGAGVKEIVIDKYEGSLAPLIVLEVEFETLPAADGYLPPSFVTCEVTHDPRFKNAHLATLMHAPPVTEPGGS